MWDFRHHRIKLIDSETKKPLINTTLWIVNNLSGDMPYTPCYPPECNDFSFTGVTNTLGNFYYPISALKDSNGIAVIGYKIAGFPGDMPVAHVSLDRVK